MDGEKNSTNNKFPKIKNKFTKTSAKKNICNCSTLVVQSTMTSSANTHEGNPAA